jgi:hypothetical protein
MKKFLGTIIICLLFFESVAQTKEFTAMEYVGGIGNRILKVWITDSLVFAAKVKGLPSVTTDPPLDNTQLVVSPENRNNTDFYVDEEKSNRYSQIDFFNHSKKIPRN